MLLIFYPNGSKELAKNGGLSIPEGNQILNMHLISPKESQKYRFFGFVFGNIPLCLLQIILINLNLSFFCPTNPP